MRRNQLPAAALAILLTAIVGLADPPSTRLAIDPDHTDVAAWARRIQVLVPKGWTVTTHDQDVIVQRDAPVTYARDLPNAPANAKPDLFQGTYHFTLRFGPKLSIEDYDKLAADNAVSAKKSAELERSVNHIAHKFDEYVATNPADAEQLAAYRAATAALTFHTLPDLYTPDASIFFFTPHAGGGSYPYDKDVAKECWEVEDRLTRYFGVYNIDSARGNRSLGRPEP
jgi:hypothetical protein